jgi:hypothetical protein
MYDQATYLIRPVQSHVSYSAIVAITRQPADPFRVGNLEFVASTIHVPSDHVHNILPVDTDDRLLARCILCVWHIICSRF